MADYKSKNPVKQNAKKFLDQPPLKRKKKSIGQSKLLSISKRVLTRPTLNKVARSSTRRGNSAAKSSLKL